MTPTATTVLLAPALVATALLGSTACSVSPSSSISGSASVADRDPTSAERSDSAGPPVGLIVRAGEPVAPLPGEVRLQNVRQLTFGGQNAEAYWSFDGKKLIWQATRPPYDCDQIFVVDLETGEEELCSTGKGRTTCAYFLKGDEKVIYASTHLADEKCPPPAMRPPGRYVWAIYPGYDIFVANPDGSDLRPLTTTNGYDAEGTVCPVTGRIVFTSTRDGDLEVYSMAPDGSDVKRLTHHIGYDGGAFYSPDGEKIVLRSGFPESDEAKQEYLDFLGRDLVAPSHMEITVMDKDGGNFRRITNNGKANFAPFWHPDGRHIVFASNMNDPKGRDFDIFMMDEDGSGLEQITFNDSFDGFPMFSPDGKHVAFASNRYGKEHGETNVFVAEWVEQP